MFAEELTRRLTGVLDLSAERIGALREHYETLVRWNRKLNLTSVEGLEASVERHYCESLFLASRLPSGPLRIVDLGSGAGFPGLPVAVARPDCAVTLIESHQRKAVFLRETSRHLANVRVVAKRFDEVNEEFDFGISRAVGYRDLFPSLKRIAQNADLLTGAEEPPSTVGFSWDPAVLLPWGRERFLRIGRRAGGDSG